MKLKWDAAKGSSRKVEETTKINLFFFIEKSENIETNEMFSIFKEYGNIQEVVIHPKRDKRGKRYTFCRFSKVQDNGH